MPRGGLVRAVPRGKNVSPSARARVLRAASNWAARNQSAAPEHYGWTQTLWLAMKREAVSSFRERGLRSDSRRCADLQGCEGQLKQQEKKADTMKNYLLRDPKAVQPQSPARPPCAQHAGPATNLKDKTLAGALESEGRVRFEVPHRWSALLRRPSEPPRQMERTIGSAVGFSPGFMSWASRSHWARSLPTFSTFLFLLERV